LLLSSASTHYCRYAGIVALGRGGGEEGGCYTENTKYNRGGGLIIYHRILCKRDLELA
jgi:hypothetical protein